jgi:hypothetical protein
MARVVPAARVSFSGPLSPAYRCGGGGGLGECARRELCEIPPRHWVTTALARAGGCVCGRETAASDRVLSEGASHVGPNPK